jgi:transcription antitermination factor NusG
MILTPCDDRWTYSSTLTYVVDANPGRSSSAIATINSFRGMTGFVVAEVSAPLQVRIYNIQRLLRTLIDDLDMF